MARKRKPKSNDPRENHGKYSGQSEKAPKVSEGRSSPTSESSDKQQMDKKDPAEDKGGMEKPGNARATNDPEWYSKDAQLVIDAASIPYSESLGDEVKLQAQNEVYNTDGSTPQVVADSTVVGSSVPGILTLRTKATFGSNRVAQDPANVAANALYTHVRYVNSGRKNYDPADLFIYVASMADVFSFVTWCMRIYQKGFVYSQRNKYVGKALLKSENIDHNNIVTNLANFRYWLNTFINKVSSFAVPAEISYFQRRAWIYAHMYIENPDSNIKDQLYQFTPDGFYHFTLDAAGAGMLEYKLISEIVGPNKDLTVADLQAIGDWLLENITGDEDFGLMSGDILKAFNGNIIGIAPIPEEADIIPVYSEYVLLQIKNAMITHAARGASVNYKYETLTNGVPCYLGNVYQSPDGNIVSLEGVSSDVGQTPIDHTLAIGMSKVFTLNTPVPTPIDTMEISRLTIGSGGMMALTGQDPIFKLTCGADIVVDATITRFDRNTNNEWVIDNVIFDSNVKLDSWFSTYWYYVALMHKFKYAPLMYSYLTTGSSPVKVKNVACMSEVDNYTIVDWRIIKRLHEVALLSMLWVPGVAKVVNY